MHNWRMICPSEKNLEESIFIIETLFFQPPDRHIFLSEMFSVLKTQER